MALARYLLTLALLAFGGLQVAAAIWQEAHFFMLLNSLAMWTVPVTAGGLMLLWFPWRGLLMLLLYNRKTGRWRWPLMAVLATLLGLVLYLRVQPPEERHMPAHPQDPNTLRIASLNALHPNENLAPKVAFVRSANADVMSIVEARPSWVDELPLLADVYPHQQVTPVASNYGTYNMILLSKHPFRRVLVQDEGRIVHYDVDGPTGTFRLVQVHPFSPLTPVRHLARNAAIEELAQVETTLPVVITGDFNTVPWQRNIKRLMARFDLKMAGVPEPTFPAYRVVFFGRQWWIPPMVPLDYVLVPQSTRVLASGVYYVPQTDHLAVMADIHLLPN